MPLNDKAKPLLFKPTVAVRLVPANVVPVPANLVVFALGNALLVIADVALVCWKRLDALVLIAAAVIALVFDSCCNEWLRATWPPELEKVMPLAWLLNDSVLKLLEPPEAENATG